jgi:hypothetical protein
MFRTLSKRFWVTVVVCVAAFVFYFPSLVAFRYTASPQNVTFLYRPWKSWSFAYTALTVPGDAKLKTSGDALREAERIWPGPLLDVGEVRVLFLEEGQPYTFTHDVLGDDITTTVTPTYDFVWQVRGTIGRTDTDTVIGLLDYRTGKVLYDVRSDLPASLSSPVPPTSTATPSSQTSPAPSATTSSAP